MKAALIFTGSGPILVLTTFESLADENLADKLTARGINKFIAYEVPVEQVKKQYGTRFAVIMGDLSQQNDLRVMDIDGHHVLNNFSFEQLGKPVFSSAPKAAAPKTGSEEEIEREWLFVNIDDNGKVVESSYIPMLGSRFEPPFAIDRGAPPKRVRFQINEQGIIINASPPILNGRKLVLPGRSSPALGRTDTVTPTCTWKPGGESGWVCA